MKENLSALMDDALDGKKTIELMQALKSNSSLRGDWDVWHLVGDSLRDHNSSSVSRDFIDRVMARLSEEPTVLAPMGVKPASRELARRYLMPIAASVAGMGVVAWLALNPGHQPGERQTMAQSGAGTSSGLQVVSVSPVASAEVKDIAKAAANDGLTASVSLLDVPNSVPGSEYLVAHQAYSPMAGVRGVAHYVRSVADMRQNSR